jgi:hypothetical protein
MSEDRFAALRALPRLTVPVLAVPEAAPLSKPGAKNPGKRKPNEPCSCGSHIKYKKCCMHKQAPEPNSLAKMQELLKNNKPMADAFRQMASKMAQSGPSTPRV